MLRSCDGAHCAWSRLVLFLLLTAGTAVAGPVPPYFDMDRLRLNPGAREGLVVGAGDLLPVHGFRLAFTTDYQHRPLDLGVGAQAVDARLTTRLLAGYGVSHRFEAGVDVPVVAWQRGAKPLAFGAPRLQGRFGLLREQDGQWLDFTLTLGATLPLGWAEAFTFDPWPNSAFIFCLGAGRSLGFVRLGLELGAVARGKMDLRPDAPGTAYEIGSFLEGGMVLSTTGKGVRAEVSVRGTLPLSRSFPGGEVNAALRYPFGGSGLEAFVLVGPGFGSMPGTPRFRGLLGIACAHALTQNLPHPRGGGESPRPGVM